MKLIDLEHLLRQLLISFFSENMHLRLSLSSTVEAPV